MTSVKQAHENCQDNDGHCLLDVRTASEWSKGIPQDAICLELNDIIHLAGTQLSKENHYYVICQTHRRSAMAIDQLRSLGFVNLHHIEEGYIGWIKHNLPIQIPVVNNEDLRYQRHYQLKDFGRKGQEKLNNAHVLLIGAGGLGSSCALYLAAAGVGRLTIIDDDVVSLSNLHRQIIHTTDSIGSLKVKSAHKQLLAINPNITIKTIAERINSENAKSLLTKADVVIDGSDNLETRYLVNDNCAKLKTPLVYAAVYQYEAQITTFDFRIDDSPCLSCLFPQTKGFEPDNCTTEGVLGVVPGLAGVIQATETIKLLTGIGEVLNEKLLIIDLLDNGFRTIKYSKDQNCRICNKTPN